MAIASNFPAIRPSLDLNFAAGNFDPRITFSRASAATYYDGKTVAKAEENLLTYSTIITGTGWGATAASSTANASVAPDGSMTAGKQVASASAGYHAISRGGFTFSMSNDFVFSFYAKAAEYSLVYAADHGNGSFAAYFDLTAVTATAAYGANRSAGITDVGNGWYRCWVKFTGGGLSASGISLIGYPVGATLGPFGAQYAGDGTSGIYLWGAQLEQRSQVTAYAPTTDQPITNYIPVLQTALSGVPRIDHDPVTGECKGLLIEEQRTNLLYPSDGSGSFGNANGVTLTPIVVPGGTTSSCLWNHAGDTSNRYQVTIPAGTYASGTTLAISWFQKRVRGGGVGRCLAAQNHENASNVDYGTLISYCGNGWERYKASCIITDGSLLTYVRMYITQIADMSVFNTFAIWGLQVEAGAFPTSYIKTEASQVTRAADSAQMTGSNFSSWYRQDEGTLYGKAASKSNASLLTVWDGTSNNRIAITCNSALTTTSSGFVVRDGAAQTSGFSHTFSAENNVALAYKANDVATTANGASVQFDTSVLLPRVSGMILGVSGTPFNGHIKRLTYYPKRLTDAQLQALTA